MLQRVANYLAGYIQDATGKLPKVQAGEGGIQLSVAQDIENPEGYRLTVAQDGIEIAGGSPAGVFYGAQTLRKSIPASAQGMDIELPAVQINDAPRFAYRGLHFDVSRHFFPVDSVKRFIDMLALHNMNRLHWHLTDDQGWRIEIKKYPKLTEIGSQRKETVIGHNSGKYDGQPYGGFYTQDQIRDVIRYAEERFVTIVPEIDLPGHQLAALAAYPELGCTGGPYDVWTMWGIAPATTRPCSSWRTCWPKSSTSSPRNTSTWAATNAPRCAGRNVPSARHASGNWASAATANTRRRCTCRATSSAAWRSS